jgi:hypothetical protein
MAVYQDREAFIPYRRTDLIELCIEDGKLSPAEVPKFRDFCKILSAYYHFHFHQTLENLKDNYAPFHPDAETKTWIQPSSTQLQEMETQLTQDFTQLLERANYFPLSADSLQRAFQEKSLIELRTDVDFNEFDRMVCYCRGDIYDVTYTKKWFRKIPITVDIFERVALLIKFKNSDYFEPKNTKINDLNFIPGKTYVYLYKNVPKFDLEFLFPNVKISMTWKDRLLFGIPAIGAAIPLLLRVLPQLFLITAVILFMIFGPSALDYVQAREEDVKNIMPALIASLSLLVTLGGFAFKQYNNYKNKQIQFQKKVTETLFFRNLAINSGVFQSLIDAAEEEECKEIILVFYHLLTNPDPMKSEALDDQIEQWMEWKFNTKIDFDIDGPLKNLQQIRGKMVSEGEEEENLPDLPLLTYDEQGCCQVLSLDQAKIVIDYVWDNAFQFAK